MPEELQEKIRQWFGDHIWGEEDFGGLENDDYAELKELFDLVLPDWRDWTWRAQNGKG
jgi:hypothetical protein